ncbi:MAG: hypothetical protein U0263_02225 [Polyangiaceae bacterium]
MSLACFGRAGLAGVAGVVCLAFTSPCFAQTDVSVCVEVRQKNWTEPKAQTRAPSPKGSQPALPEAWAFAAEPGRAASGFDPAQYLRRLLEYEVTHEPGFHSQPKSCSEKVTVELYPLQSGWTVFARYSGTAREEKVDAVELDEFPQLAQRLAYALLRDTPIQRTITRENVLRADSEHAYRTIHTRGHMLLSIGTEFRVGKLGTAEDESSPAEERWRLLTPVSFQLGYRGKFKEWGLDVLGRMSIGSRERAARNNPEGGHVDFTGSGSLGLHFLRYVDPPGMNSFYFGGGASFDLMLFSVIRPKDARSERDRDYLLGAGLDVDLLVGYEFLRASSLHFFAEAQVSLPTYAIRTESSYGAVDAYLPGGLAQIGVLF